MASIAINKENEMLEALEYLINKRITFRSFLLWFIKMLEHIFNV